MEWTAKEQAEAKERLRVAAMKPALKPENKTKLLNALAFVVVLAIFDIAIAHFATKPWPH